MRRDTSPKRPWRARTIRPPAPPDDFRSADRFLIVFVSLSVAACALLLAWFFFNPYIACTKSEPRGSSRSRRTTYAKKSERARWSASAGRRSLAIDRRWLSSGCASDCAWARGIARLRRVGFSRRSLLVVGVAGRCLIRGIGGRPVAA